MGIFSRKNKDDFLREFEENAAANITFNEKETNRIQNTVQPDHALTSEEIIFNFGEISGHSTPKEVPADPLEAMKQRMLKNVAQNKEKKEQPKQEIQKKQEKEENFFNNFTFQSDDEVKPSASPENQKDTTAHDNAANNDTKHHNDTLLKRCMAYLVDDDGNDAAAHNEPLYKLESVADILKTDSERTLESLSKKYDINMEELKQTSSVDTSKSKPQMAKPSAKQNNFDETAYAKKVNQKNDIFEEILAGLNSSKTDTKESLPDISDIDTDVLPRESFASQDNTATIKFTPVRMDNGQADRMSVTTINRAVDLTEEFKIPESNVINDLDDDEPEIDEFEEFVLEDEYQEPSDGKRLLRKCSIKKRNAFFQVAGSLLAVIILAVFALPFAGDFLLKNTTVGMTVCSIVLGISVLINGDMALSLPRIFCRRSAPDCVALMASVSSLALGIAGAIKVENEHPMMLVCAVVLFFRALSKFYNIAAKLGNLKQLTIARPKKAVTLLTDEATTFAMAKKAIDGDALIAVPRETSMVLDFMKYSEYDTPLGNQMRVVNILSLMLSVCLGLVAGAYYRGLVAGLFTASAVLCVFALPTLFLINALPNYKAAIKLNKKGSMIAGISAAKHLELANAVVVSARDIFPDNMVVMRDMKVLSSSNVDEVFVRAASLTEALNSPLTAIFKRIAGTNKAYKVPDSDTVKYEEKMGISGWVEEELMFIGNRTLLEAHGITVPDVEVDRKILRQGYFPVYIACGNKACAMVMVQYNVDEKIAQDLHTLTSLGVTVLVDNCDPNLTDEMICDYMGLYEDSVKTMSNSGCHMYHNAVTPTDSCSAPAAFRGNPFNIISVINCASRIKHSNIWLSVFYIIAAVVGCALFVYVTFAGSDVLPTGMSVLACQLAITVLSYLIFLIKKP